MEKWLKLQKQDDGFALVAAVLIVSVMTVAAIPLMNVVGTSQESAVKQQVVVNLSNDARENLELAVYLTKSSGGTPGYFNTTHTPASTAMAQPCQARINAADPSLIGAGNSLTLLTNAAVAPVTSIGTRRTTTFVVDKGTSGDDRYHRYLVASCAIADNFGISVFTSELANIQGSFYTLNLNEY